MASKFDASIIVPCFNGAKYIPKLADTLQSLRKEVKEVIFVDDGSTDESAELFSKLVPYAQVLRQQNAGVAAARNAGAAVAAGEFLQFLDVDDVILPGKFAAQVPAALQDGVAVVYSDWQMVVVHGEGTVREPPSHGAMPCEPVQALLMGWWVPPHAYLFRRSSYEQVGGGNRSLVNAQDFDLVLRIAIAGGIFSYVAGHYVDYYRYLDTKSLARGPRKQYWTDYEKAVVDALRLLSAAGSLTPARRKAAALKLHSVARGTYSVDRDCFERTVARIHQLDPDFKPLGTAPYKAVAGLFGLRAAEFFAERTREWRRVRS